MRVIPLAVLFLCLAGATRAGDDAANAKELEKLEGTWVPIALATAEGPKNLNETKMEKIVIKGNKQFMHEQGKVYEYSFTIDPTKKPKEKDTTFTHLGKTTMSLHIYDLQGNTLKIANGGDTRPTSFDKLPKGGVMFVYRRAK